MNIGLLDYNVYDISLFECIIFGVWVTLSNFIASLRLQACKPSYHAHNFLQECYRDQPAVFVAFSQVLPRKERKNFMWFS